MKSELAKLPNSSQFSPVQTPLPELLSIVQQNEPKREAVRKAIEQRFFTDRAEHTEWHRKLADNTVIAMSQYGLINKPPGDISHVSLTALGHSLAEKAESGQVAALYDEFAVHILLNLHGLDLISVADDLVRSGLSPTKASIVKELRNRGIYHPPNGTHANGMRQWLESAGLVEPTKWVANPNKLQELLGGATMDDLEAFSSLTLEQRAFVKAFARLNTDEAFSNKVAQYATELYGVEFPEGELPLSILFPIRDAGLVYAEKTTSGQGAKPYIVRPTEKLKNELIEPMLDAIENSIGIQYRKLIRMRLSDILTGLQNPSKHEKGLALEALAFYLGRLLRLDFVEWRLRSNKTGGAELDVVMEGAHLIFSRWQIQCKNASQATLEDVAKEVGIAQVIKANVILVVTTGRIGPAARQFAVSVMANTNLYVALLDGRDLVRLGESPAEIASIMQSQAHGAMMLKRGQVAL